MFHVEQMEVQCTKYEVQIKKADLKDGAGLKYHS